MEQKLNVRTDDGKDIFCMHTTGTQKSDTVAVLVHGLTGNLNDHILHNAARVFPKEGVDVFRFALYWFEENNRCLSDCSLTTHAKDLDRVLEHLRPDYSKIAVVGHSCGAPTILKASTDLFDTVVFWDPSYLENGVRHELTPIEHNGTAYWLSRDEMEYLLSKELVEEWEWFNGSNELSVIKALGKPLKIIAAGEGVLIEGSRAYAEVAQEPKDLTLIKGATHAFDEEGTEEELLKETLSWIKEH